MKIGPDGKPADLIQDEPPKETEENTKKTFRDKLEEFWYFYKWQTVISVILIIGIGLGIAQLFANKEPDAGIMYVGPGYISASVRAKMTKIAEYYLNDYNADGEKYLSILDITASGDKTKTAYESNVDAVKRFNLEITAGDSLIYLVEESFYEELKEYGVLAKLSSIIDGDKIPDNTYDEYGVRISNLDFFDIDGFSSLPKDTVLCIRQSPEGEAIAYGRTVEFWNSNKALFKAMFDFRSEEKPAKPIPVFDVAPYDVGLMYVGYNRIYEITRKSLSDKAVKYFTDSNKSDSKELGVDYRIVKKTGNAYTDNPDDAAYFEKQLESGNNIIFIVEKSFYDKLYESGQLLSLESVFSYKDSNGETVTLLPDAESEDGYGVRVSELKFFKEISGFDVFEDDLVLCIRNRPEGCDKNFFNACVEFYRQIMYYQSDTESGK